ncbi:MAG TPA: S1-like domain-containing RNA-binding protein, partial [Gammaproteobacteria bacterium]
MNTLTVARVRDNGIYLDGGAMGEILLPPREAPPACQVGDRLELFVYVDSDGTLLATPARPLALADEFAYLRVVSLTRHGAFLEWGLKKNLLVPYGEQNGRMEEGRSYIVYLYREPDTQRIAASAKLERFIDTAWPPYQRGEQVELLICEHTDIGYKAIVAHRHWGVIHDEDVFESLRYGDIRKGYIKKVRDDGKIDLQLQPIGYAKIDAIAADILAKLRDSGGFMAVGDKSSPETIQQLFGV